MAIRQGPNRSSPACCKMRPANADNPDAPTVAAAICQPMACWARRDRCVRGQRHQRRKNRCKDRAQQRERHDHHSRSTAPTRSAPTQRGPRRTRRARATPGSACGVESRWRTGPPSTIPSRRRRQVRRRQPINARGPRKKLAAHWPGRHLEAGVEEKGTNPETRSADRRDAGFAIAGRHSVGRQLPSAAPSSVRHPPARPMRTCSPPAVREQQLQRDQQDSTPAATT